MSVRMPLSILSLASETKKRPTNQEAAGLCELLRNYNKGGA